jgi:integration host factor subunit alpha
LRPSFLSASIATTFLLLGKKMHIFTNKILQFGLRLTENADIFYCQHNADSDIVFFTSKIAGEFKNMEKTTVTRDKVARAIKRETGVNIKKAAEILDDALLSIIDKLKHDKSVSIRLFGTFSTSQKKQRIGRNPKTMKEAVIPARKVVRFKVSPTLKKRINDNIK